MENDYESNIFMLFGEIKSAIVYYAENKNNDFKYRCYKDKSLLVESYSIYDNSDLIAMIVVREDIEGNCVDTSILYDGKNITYVNHDSIDFDFIENFVLNTCNMLKSKYGYVFDPIAVELEEPPF